MTKKLERIVKEAEFTPILEEGEEVKKPENVVDLSNIADMVMVGRYKNGEEFVIPIGMDDALKAKGYADYAVSYFNILTERSIFNRIQAQENNKNE